MSTFSQTWLNFRFLLVILLMTGLWACQAKKPDPASRPVIDPPDRVHQQPTQRTYEVFGVHYTPIDSAEAFRETGIASWYGDPFHGRKTASGETYNMHASTAAHRTLPMGTFLKVRNLENDKEIIVRINDRGPFAKDRIIDLSYHSAKKIDMIQQGTVSVEIIAIAVEDKDLQAHVSAAHADYFTGDFTVQVGSYADKNRAEALRKQLQDLEKEVFVTQASVDGRTVYRVRVGRFSTLDDARQLQTVLTRNGYDNAIAVSGVDK